MPPAGSIGMTLMFQTILPSHAQQSAATTKTTSSAVIRSRLMAPGKSISQPLIARVGEGREETVLAIDPPRHAVVFVAHPLGFGDARRIARRDAKRMPADLYRPIALAHHRLDLGF